jgi:hypothetical protein
LSSDSYKTAGETVFVVCFGLEFLKKSGLHADAKTNDLELRPYVGKA